MTFETNYQVERFILETDWDMLPSDVQRRAVDCSIDLMTALILGAHGRQYRVGVGLADKLGLTGNIPVFCHEGKYNLLGASIAFSHASNSFDIDDGYNLVKGHPGSSFISGVLAGALEKDHTYKKYLETLVVCYEIGIRWGSAEQEYYNYLHSTGAYGAFATAAGLGRLLGLSKEQLNNALSIADYHAPMTPVMRAVQYPSMNKDGVPFGSLVGTMAVLETLAGETGRTHLLEAPEFKHYVDSLGEKFYIRDLYFKPYTCCRWAHQPISACISLKSTFKIDADAVEYVRVHTFEAAARLSQEAPKDTDEAQYNIAFPVAAAIVYGDVGYLQVRDEAVQDRKVLDMMSRLSFVIDPEMEKGFPARRLAWVEMGTNDGKVYRSEVFEAPGENTDPEIDHEWFVKKFKRVTAPVLSESGQLEILSLLCGDLRIRMGELAGAIKRAIET